ncbi:helix-turn-helix domain-containing protein [Pseudomonas frederiksbergensis]|uniref:Transcriptional regulator n=1 Tax=Pseudomonas frederiksbergensis TaxID=104087 RepID=A0A423KNK8_9PSED|nr:helix-turn-helix transcriptional regulator [Pseudomonas frederiksbergensis]RON55988.1 transcriptional regulator [Pseudomonas frederiksbergensis]
MELKKAFGRVLNRIRILRGYTQEDFSIVSSRTYISTLERGIYSPTLDKLDEIASVVQVHPVSLLVACYALRDDATLDEIFEQVKIELDGGKLLAGLAES